MMAAICLGPPGSVLGVLLGRDGMAAAGVLLAGFWEVCWSMGVPLGQGCWWVSGGTGPTQSCQTSPSP